MDKDIYQTVTDRIVAAIEAGAGEWQMPWVRQRGGLPVNAVTRQPYNGVNVLTLWLEAEGRDYPTHQWASYKQWASVGAQVRKGEKGSVIVFYKTYTKEVETMDGTEEQKKWLLRYSYVFNAAQVDNWSGATPIVLPDLAERIEHAEQFVAATKAEIKYGGGRACYIPSLDRINMPEFAAFNSTEAAYGTLLHELMHWSGTEKRCNRELGKRFGSEAYAVEELVAELGSAFLCAELGITKEPRQDHAQYLANWLAVLKADKKAIFTAAGKASAAATYLKSLQPQAQETVQQAA